VGIQKREIKGSEKGRKKGYCEQPCYNICSRPWIRAAFHHTSSRSIKKKKKKQQKKRKKAFSRSCPRGGSNARLSIGNYDSQDHIRGPIYFNPQGLVFGVNIGDSVLAVA
jgi:hypothetical protein